jgi:ApbE superfamily uncharacterized protein (UPF0280 family)
MFRCLSEKSFTPNKIGYQSDLIRYNYQIEETKGIIITDYLPAVETALECIMNQRRLLRDYIRFNPSFKSSLLPMEVNDAPKVVKLMIDASQASGVGPMAAVAGVIADLSVKAMIKNKAKIAVVENGGEIALYGSKSLIVSLGVGNHLLSHQFGFKLTNFPCGVATSSGRHSHAFSMGDADTVTVFADNSGLADAIATAAANVVTGDPGKDVKKGVITALTIKGVHGVLAIRDEKVAMGGVLPEIISLRGDNHE